MTTDENIDEQITDEQRAEAIAVLKRLIAGEEVDRPRWMIEARERADRLKAAMQNQRARDHDKPAQNPAQAATAATFRTDKDDLPTADQKADQQPDPAATQPAPKYSEEDMFVFTDDLGEKVR
jgi:hypothetical protein